MKNCVASLMSLTMLLSFIIAPGSNVSAATNDEDKYQALFSAMTYNFNSGKILFDEEVASASYSFTQDELDFYTEGFDALSPQESRGILTALGVNLEELYQKTLDETYGDGPQPRILPLVIAAFSFLGGAAAGKIIDEAMTYGIVKTCQKHKKNYYKTNGHL